MRSRWVRATRKTPCPICGKPDWCCLSDDGEVANCMRTESAKPARNGGWIHRLTELPRRAEPIARRVTTPPRLSNPAALLARWRADTTPTLVRTLAGDLGVTTAALDALGAAYAAPRQAWAFPMRDGASQIVGIRLRADGRKWAVDGSRQGLFYADDVAGTVLICEGPTDTAAALTLGFQAIGRPSCTGGIPELVAMVARGVISRAIIIADDDTPGRRGAVRLAEALAVPKKLLAVPAKDLRDFVRAGATAALVREMLTRQEWMP